MRKKIQILLLCSFFFIFSVKDSFALFGKMTISDEEKIGKEFDTKAQSMLLFVEDPEITSYVKDIIARLAREDKILPFRIKTRIVQNSAINAFAVPGGYIYVFTGLIENLNTEDEFAAVLAHEIAHVSRRHVAKRAEQTKLTNIISLTTLIAGALLGASGGENSQNIAGALILGGQAAATQSFLNYTRENEQDADHHGIETLIAANYNPKAMVSTFQIMYEKVRLYINSNIPSYLSTHPALLERVSYLNNRLQYYPQKVLDRPQKNEQFLRIKALAQGKYADASIHIERIEKSVDNSALALLTKALFYERLNRKKNAEETFLELLEKEPNDPLFLREAGRFFFQQGDLKQSLNLILRSMSIAPNDTNTQFVLAKLYAAQKENALAAKLLLNLLREFPRNAEIHQELGKVLGKEKQFFDAHKHLYIAAFFTKNQSRMQIHLRKMTEHAVSKKEKKELEQFIKKPSGKKRTP